MLDSAGASGQPESEAKSCGTVVIGDGDEDEIDLGRSRTSSAAAEGILCQEVSMCRSGSPGVLDPADQTSAMVSVSSACPLR